MEQEDENDEKATVIKEELIIEEDEADKIDKKSSSSLNYFHGFKFKNGQCKIKFKVPLDGRKLLMLNLVEQVLKLTFVNEVKGISKSHLIINDKGPKYQIQTEGVNFKACWNIQFLDSNKIQSNDIQALCSTYGLEAGFQIDNINSRQSIINEIKNVFGVYHISVDHRHLSLIADYMTQSGEIRAMNRSGMNNNASAFLRMSFETTMGFLMQASLCREIEKNKSPSSQIVLGRAPSCGTGMFDIKHIIKS